MTTMYDPNAYKNCATLDRARAENQASDDYLKLPDDVATPLLFLRSGSDTCFATDGYGTHFYECPRTQRRHRISCGRAFKQPCAVCDLADQLRQNRQMDGAGKAIQNVLTPRDRHLAMVAVVTPWVEMIKEMAQAQKMGDQNRYQQLLNQVFMELHKIKAVEWDMPKTVYAQIVRKSAQAIHKYGKALDVSWPGGAALTWVTKVSKGHYCEYEVDIDGTTLVPIPLPIMQGLPTYDSLLKDKETEALGWTEERVHVLFGLKQPRTDNALPPSSPPPQAPVYQPAYQQPPQPPQQPVYQQPPQPPMYQPPTPQPAPPVEAQPVAQVPPAPQPQAPMVSTVPDCMGRYSPAKIACDTCPSKDPCLQQVIMRANAPQAPAQAPPVAAPQAPAQQPPIEAQATVVGHKSAAETALSIADSVLKGRK